MLRSSLRRCLPLALTLFIADIVNAGPAIEVGKLELYPTLLAVGIEVDFTGDDNQNAAASFVWKKAGEAGWRTGVDMTIDRKHRKIWASIWPLEQGTPIEVEIRVTDSDAGKIAPIVGQTKVRTLVLEGKGRTLHVAPTGDDANAGSADKPFKTIAHAGKQAKAGDTVVLAGGVYAEGDLWAGVQGTAENSIVLRAAEGQTPILDSSLELPVGHAWQAAGEGVFSTTADFTGGYLAQDGLRSFPYEAVADLKSDKFKVSRGWFYDKTAKTLYVRTGTTKPASEYRFHLSRHDYGLHLSRSKYVVVRGLELRNYGAACIRLSEGARGCVVYDNHLHNAQNGIFMKSDTTQENTIWKNHIHEPGGPEFTWAAYYSVGYGNQAIYCTKAGRGNSFCYNVMHDYFDLMSIESWKNPDKIGLHRDTDIMFNELFNASDDAIEVDGGGVNMRIHGNAIRNCHTAISLAPIERGPVYVTRNHATFLAMLFKFNVGGCTSLGPTFCYHNSGQCLVDGADDAGTGFSFPKKIPCANKTLKNNVVVVNEWCARDGQKGYVLDANSYYAVAGRPPRRFHWEGKAYNTIELFAAATGNEKSGLYADPLFVSVPPAKAGHIALAKRGLVTSIATAGDLHLQPTSPCIDRAVRIPGVNDDFLGKGPDMGAFETK